MTPCFFVSDLHGQIDRYEKLFAAIGEAPPAAVFLGGDLLPSGLSALSTLDPAHRDFVNDFLAPGFQRLREGLGRAYPRVFLILGNDDSLAEETGILEGAARGCWEYVHCRSSALG